MSVTKRIYVKDKIMIQLLTYPDIDPQQWQALVDRSPYATWFQTKEAYEFYAAVSAMQPFAVGVEEVECKVESGKCKGLENSAAETTASTPYTLHPTPALKGVIVGYITRERNAIKQFFTRRAIIIGGPLLDEHISDEALSVLLSAIAQCKVEGLKFKGVENSKADTLAFTPYTLHPTPIYIESRNFHDYSKWRNIFETNGFAYQPHLNFHVDTTQPWETIENNIGKHRRKYIRLSYRDGVEVELDPTLQQVKEYYAVLQDLYRTKVRMPLQPWSFFERLYHLPSCKYLLVLYNNQVVGGSICMILKNHGVYEWYACGKDGMFRNIHPSSVTKHIGMKYASDNGYKVFDMMGAGKPNEAYGVRDFKAEFGGKLVEHGRFLCIRKPLLYWIGILGVKLLKKR